MRRRCNPPCSLSVTAPVFPIACPLTTQENKSWPCNRATARSWHSCRPNRPLVRRGPSNFRALAPDVSKHSNKRHNQKRLKRANWTKRIISTWLNERIRHLSSKSGVLFIVTNVSGCYASYAPVFLKPQWLNGRYSQSQLLLVCLGRCS